MGTGLHTQPYVTMLVELFSHNQPQTRMQQLHTLQRPSLNTLLITPVPLQLQPTKAEKTARFRQSTRLELPQLGRQTLSAHTRKHTRLRDHLQSISHGLPHQHHIPIFFFELITARTTFSTPLLVRDPVGLHIFLPQQHLRLDL